MKLPKGIQTAYLKILQNYRLLCHDNYYIKRQIKILSETGIKDYTTDCAHPTQVLEPWIYWSLHSTLKKKTFLSVRTAVSKSFWRHDALSGILAHARVALGDPRATMRENRPNSHPSLAFAAIQVIQLQQQVLLLSLSVILHWPTTVLYRIHSSSNRSHIPALARFSCYCRADADVLLWRHRRMISDVNNEWKFSRSVCYADSRLAYYVIFSVQFCKYKWRRIS